MSGVFDNPLSSLDVFWTELSPNRAVVYARLTDVPYQTGWRLTGTIRGPRSIRHQTLAATVPFKDLGLGPTHLARAVVPEPSYWSPESPNIYDVTIELHRGGEPTLVEKRMLGFKPIRAGERYLLRESKPWVLRGMSLPNPNLPNVDPAKTLDFISKARDEGLVVQTGPEQGLWKAASEQGLCLMTMIFPSKESLGDQLRECSKHPAVTIIVVPYYADRSQPVPKDGHNLILVQPLCQGIPYEACDWADAVCCGTWALDDPAQGLAGISKPVLIGEPCETPIDVSNARAHCDALQRRLAPARQFAGYHVGTRQ